MARAARSAAKRARHKKWIKRAAGYRGRRSRVFKLAKEAVIKAGQHAYRDRRRKKATFRALWQTHINAAARSQNVSYSAFIRGLRQHQVGLNRKMLATLARDHSPLFHKIVDLAQQSK